VVARKSTGTLAEGAPAALNPHSPDEAAILSGVYDESWVEFSILWGIALRRNLQGRKTRSNGMGIRGMSVDSSGVRSCWR
jgi:hypothetical protein